MAAPAEEPAPAPRMDDLLLQALEQSDQASTLPRTSLPAPVEKSRRSRSGPSMAGWLCGWLLTLATVAGGAWYGWQEWLEPRLRHLEEKPAILSMPPPAAPSPPAGAPPQEVSALRQELQQLREAMKTQREDTAKLQNNAKAASPAPDDKPVEPPDLQALRQEIQQLGASLKTQQQEVAMLQGSLKASEEKFAAALARIKESNQPVAAAPPLPTAVQAPLLADPQAGEKAEKLLPAGELQFMKERNRLTSYADEAIALASRDAYESLWRALKSPDLTRLRDGTKAEILRVRTMFFSSSRLGEYTLPLAELFPEATPKKEADLASEQLGKLLLDAGKDWRIRARAAQLLGRRPSMEACDTLAKALESDANLEVLKECQFAFEQNTRFQAEVLDYAAGPAWWKTNREEFLKRAQPRPAGG